MSHSGGDLLTSSSTFSVEFQPQRNKLEKDIARQEKKAKQVLRRSALSNSDRIIDRDLLKEVINESQQRWLGCLMLPVTILFFAFYSIAAALHEDVSSSHLIEAPVRTALVPPLDDWEEPTPAMLQGVSTPGDVFYFLENTFLPLFFAQSTAYGTALPEAEWSTIYKYNKVQGMVILELQRSTKIPCEDEEAGGMFCYPEGNLTNVPYGLDFADFGGDGGSADYTEPSLGPGNTWPIIYCADEGFTVEGCVPDSSRRLRPLRDDLAPKMPRWDSDAKYTYRFMLDPLAPYSVTQARLQYLKERGWLDDQSTQLRIKAYYLNYQMEAARMQNLQVLFYFSRGGGVFTSLWLHGTALSTFINLASMVFDGLFGLMLVLTTIFLLHGLCKACKAGAPSAHFNFVNVITWISALVGWVNSLLLLLTTQWRSDIENNLANYVTVRSAMDVTDPQSVYDVNAAAMKFADSADFAGDAMQMVRVSIAFAHILFMFRCCISLKWQPRLAVVIRTISAMASDLIHFMIVLIPTFIAFAIAGMMMFGRRLETFATFQASMLTCFKIAMESEFRWAELSAQDFMTSAAWVWLYIPLIVLIMLNMVLAIIMDIYQEVRREAGNTMTITRHMHYIYSVFRLRATWIPYRDLYNQVCAMPQTISVLELHQAFPSMPDYQGAYLVNESINKARMMARVGVETIVTEHMVAAMHISLEEVVNDVKEMKARGWMGMGFEVSNDGERETIKDILTSVSTQQHWMGLTKKNMAALQSRVDGLTEDHKEGEDASPAGGQLLK